MKVEVGKFYKTRDGRKAQVKNVQYGEASYYVDGYGFNYILDSGHAYYDKRESQNDLIEEWKEEEPKSPVQERTVTVKEIVEGEYGNLSVYYKYQSPKTLDNLRIEVTTSVHTPEEMRAMADYLREIADAVEWNTKTAE